jgi:hypothetical protein
MKVRTFNPPAAEKRLQQLTKMINHFAFYYENLGTIHIAEGD